MYVDPLDDYYAAVQGALPYQTPAQRMQQGMGAIPTQAEFTQQPYDDTAAARAAMAPYQQPVSQNDWNTLGQAYSFAPPQLAPQEGPSTAPPLDTPIQVKEPASPLDAEPAPPRKGSGALPPHLQEMKDAFMEGQQDAADIDKQRQELYAQRQSALEQHAAQEQQKRQQEGDRLRELYDGVAKTQAELNKPAKRVDPNRYYADMDTGTRIAMALSVGIGGIGSALGAGYNRGIALPNTGLELLNQAVEKDIGLQREQLADDRQRKRDALTGSQNLYGLARQTVSDDQAARQLTKGLMLEQIANQADALSATAQSQQSQQHYAESSAQLRVMAKQEQDAAIQREYAKRQAEATLRLQERGVEIQQQGANNTALKAQGEAIQKQKERYVPGWGLALEGEAKGLREATAAFDDINKAIDAQKAEHGKRGVVDYLAHDVGINTKTDQSLIDRRKELLVLKNKAAASGVLDANNERIFDELTGGNPTDPFNVNYAERLEQLRESLRRNLEAKLKTGLEQWEPGALGRVNPSAANQQVLQSVQARPR